MAETESSSNLRAERRLALRVPVQRRIRAAVGLRAFEATLLDLSLTGCRIRCAEPITAHGSVWIVLPAGLGGRWPLPVRGEVARADSVRGEPTGVCDVALRFRALAPRAYDRVCAAVAEALAPPAEPEAELAAEERRVAPRRLFGRRVIARGSGRPRVLIASDISSGGMRVENAAGLQVSDELQLALHGNPGDVPLVMRARVLRIATNGGAALVFDGPSETQRDQLEKLLARLPEVELPVLAEIVEPDA
jgi:hypothetical protein